MRAKFFKPVLFVTALVVASLSCKALSSTPVSSDGGGAATEPPPAATQDSGSSSVDSGSTGGSQGQSATFHDDFSDKSSGWGTGTDADSSVEYADGGLHMQNFKSSFIVWSNPDSEKYSNVHIEVTAKNNKSGQAARFGILCDQQFIDSSYYYFAIRTDGHYVIAKAALAQDDVYLTNSNHWAASDLIAKNAPSYRIGADCGNGKLVLYVDGKEIDSATDATYTEGGVGLFVWNADDPGGDVTYDDFAMTPLK